MTISDEQFHIIPEIKTLKPVDEQPVQEDKKRGPGRPPITPLTEEETVTFVTGFLTIPGIFFPRIPARTPEQIKPFAHELYSYCIKKNIDVREYFFDEFGIVVSGAMLARGYWDDYRRAYPKQEKKEQSPEDKKLDADYEHGKAVSELHDQAMKDGTIKESVIND